MYGQLKLQASDPQADEAVNAVRPARLNALVNQIIAGTIGKVGCSETEQRFETRVTCSFLLVPPISGA
jgi:hypothetical protein